MDSVVLMEASLCERLWREHADRLLLYASSILSDGAAAEDALQNVFARLLAVDTLPAIESEAGYLFRAVRNEALNAIRSVRRAARAREHLFETPVGDAAEGAEDDELRVQVEGLLGGLPEEQREAVVLKIWGELSFPDMARVLGATEKTVEHRYYRGLEALEAKLK